jgi:hypothetical protein
MSGVSSVGQGSLKIVLIELGKFKLDLVGLGYKSDRKL